MTTRRAILATTVLASAAAVFGLGRHRAVALGAYQLTDAQWRAKLSPEAYDVLRQGGTEAPFSSPLDLLFKPGTYHCAGCGQALYSSTTKFDSGTGWPSFWQPLPHAIETASDNAMLMERTEVHCANCAGHLGHVFDDGPKPTGLRYCMDGVALQFQPA